MRELSFFARKNFSQPENFDSYNEGSGWVAYRGGNDWENATTGVAIVFEKPHEKSRVWFHVQFPQDIIKGVNNSSATSELADKASEWGEKATKLIIKEAKANHKKDENGITPSWSDCFINAIKSEVMKPYVKEWGVDRTEWKETKAKRKKIMNKTAILEIIKLADHLDQLGFYREAAILDRVITPEEYKLLQDKAIRVLYRSDWDALRISETLSLPLEDVEKIIEKDKQSYKDVADTLEKEFSLKK